jgi:broad specificity phosphatase PhoE
MVLSHPQVVCYHIPQPVRGTPECGSAWCRDTHTELAQVTSSLSHPRPSLAHKHSDEGNGKVKFFCSPHVRTQQTLDGVLQAIPTSNRYGLVTYDHLIRELDRGYFKQPFESVARYDAERQDHGVLHYRFPGKDSLLDVYQRVSAFLVQLHLYIGSGRVGRQDTVVLVGHAGMFKQMIGRIQGLSGDVADAMNIPNCAVHGILLLLSSPPIM